MPGLGHEVDADFYNLIHQLVGSPRKDDPIERRTDPRCPFPVVQRIAVRRGLELPDESEFNEVRCHDLTRRGFSFLLSSRPDFDSLVAAFDVSPKTIYLAARVAHVEDVLVDSSGQVLRGRDRWAEAGHLVADERTVTPMVLVGCRFTERLTAG
ncbi:MAG TPA: hypothetical protein VMY42_03345 [Thermoguttaceae bacterium]|nr:hypothetical protein [Thermoguttaceae bacterium]